MTPEECRQSIEMSYREMERHVRAGTMKRCSIFGRVESLCRDAARHNAQPNRWRDYIPEDLWREEYGED